MRGREARRHADRSADMHRERRRLGEGRALIAVGVGQLVAPERAHVEPDIAEHAKTAVKAFAGISLAPEADDVTVALIAEPRLDLIADAFDVRAIGLREVEIFQLGVQLDEGAADPAVECVGEGAHGTGLVAARRLPSRSARTCANTASNISVVSTPVFVL